MGKLFLALLLSFQFFSCTPTKNSMLSDYSSTDPCTTTACITRVASDADLFAQPYLSTKQIKVGTLTSEIDGKCSASYYSDHKIIVKVYSGTSAGGTLLSDNDSYIASTNGHMLTDLGKFYPQCIRGKFSFLVPLFDPASPLTILTSVYVQFYLSAQDSKKGDVNSAISSTLINLY